MHSSRILRSLVMVALLGPAGCAYSYTANDAGNGAWVEQVVPALVGRKPINALESKVLVDVAVADGRSAVADTLMSMPEFDAYWSMVLADALKLQRADALDQTAYGASYCWNTGTLYPTFGPGQNALANVLSIQVDPKAFAALGTFTMADVLRSSIAADDLFAPFRAQLFSLAKVGRGHPDAARDMFLSTFTNRKPVCLSCHSSGGSVSRIAPVAVDLDNALFPTSHYGNADRVYYAFRENPTDVSTTPVLGSMHALCGDILNSSIPDAHASGGEFAGLNPTFPTSGCTSFGPPCDNYDPVDLDAALFVGRSTLVAADLAPSLTTPQPVSYSHSLPAVGSGDKAFAMALALTVTEAIVKELEGHGLTLPHGQPRVDEQRSYLQSYAYYLVSSNWSLRRFLKVLVSMGTFNMRPPSQAPSAYPFPMFFNPWAAGGTGISGDVNGQGDLAHRYSVPALLTAVRHSLGWPAPKLSPNGAYPSQLFQRELGRYESVLQPGTDDVTFQGLLSWEQNVGTCRKPSGVSSDWIDAMMTKVNDAGSSFTTQDVIVAFKDRFIQDQHIQDCNVVAVEDTGSLALGKSAPHLGDTGIDWSDQEAVTTWIAEEQKLVDLRAQQREAARAYAATLEEKRLAIEAGLDPQAKDGEPPPDPAADEALAKAAANPMLPSQNPGSGLGEMPGPTNTAAALDPGAAPGAPPDPGAAAGALGAPAAPADPGAGQVQPGNANEDPEAWRGRFDEYTAQLGDETWSSIWTKIRVQTDEIGAVHALDAYGLSVGLWVSIGCNSEAQMLAAYFGVSLGYPAKLVPNMADKLRGYCGTLVTSPQFMLGGMRPTQAAADPIPAALVCLPTQPDYCVEHDLCTTYNGYLSAHGYALLTCPP